jgi:hypothetical protein
MSRQKKEVTHCIIRNGGLFCENCGSSSNVPMPITLPMFAAMIKEFTRIHKNCKKTWSQQFPNPGLSVQQKADFWLQHGERGLSSETMFHTLYYGRPSSHRNHPHDPGDFKRCLGLLRMVPEWKDDLNKMRSVSEVWDRLVEHWDILTRMYEDIQKDKDSSQMFVFMQSLGC